MNDSLDLEATGNITVISIGDSCRRLSNALPHEQSDRAIASSLAICGLHVVSSLTAFVANVLVLRTIWRTPTLRSPSYFLLFSLALSDLAVAAIAQPFYVVYKVSNLVVAGSSHKFCQVGGAWAFTSTYLILVSLITVTLVNVDRFLAIHLHMRYRVLVTNKRVICSVLCAWIGSMMLSTSFFWEWRPNFYLITICFTSSIIVSVALYVRVFLVIRRHQRHIKAQERCGYNAGAHFGTMTTVIHHKKNAINMLLVYSLVLICYVPYLCVVMVRHIHGPSRSLFFAVHLTIAIVCLNSTVNPFLFSWRLRDIRLAIKEDLRRLHCKGTRNIRSNPVAPAELTFYTQRN